MRFRLAVLASVLVVLLGIAQPAAASPATPISLNGCLDMGEGLTYCYTASGVAQGNMARNNLKVSVNMKVDYTITHEGVFILSQRVSFHFNGHFKSGEPHVMQQTQRSRFSFTLLSDPSITLDCSLNSNVIYANGAVRHGVERTRCVQV